MNRYKTIVKLLQASTGAARLAAVFEDFVEMAALSFRNSVVMQGWDEREAASDQLLGAWG